MKQRQSDPIINEVREVGHRISARFDHGPARLVAFYLEMQKQHHQRLTREHGHPKLLQHLAGVMALMRRGIRLGCLPSKHGSRLLEV